MLGYTFWERHALWMMGALSVCTLAMVPVLGIDVLGLTPYLGAYSALQVPAPQWRWTTGVIALVPDGSCSRRATDAEIGTDFADREYTPPPGPSSFWS